MPTVASRRLPAEARSIFDAKWLAAAILAVAILAAYYNGLHGPFVYDDTSAIVENPTIRNLRDLGTVLSPPSDSGITVNGRPLVNLSFAINYAIGGTNVVGYHWVNMGIHFAAGLFLLGLLRRTFQAPMLRSRLGAHASTLALIVTLMWAVHPLQTESVTYVVQRAEALVGLFYLAMLYAWARGADSKRPFAWRAAALLACICGMASKEVMVSAPLVAFFYDRTFLSGSFRETWKQRGGWFCAFALTWVFLGYLIASTGSRGGTAGFGIAMQWWRYPVIQCWAVPTYLWLTLFPNQLIFDYGYGSNVLFCISIAGIVIGAAVLVALLVTTAISLKKRPVIGFALLSFFAILSPSSSIVPILTEPVAEHRMYLALAFVLPILPLAAFYCFGRSSLKYLWLIVPALGLGTIQRNKVYQSEIALWQDTVEKLPCSARAQNNLGHTLFVRGEMAAAVERFNIALAIIPGYVDARANLGNTMAQLGSALAHSGQVATGIRELEAALALDPKRVSTLSTLGAAHYSNGDHAAAVRYLDEALRLRPLDAEANSNRGVVYLATQQPREAKRHFEIALAQRPAYPEALYNLGNALAGVGDRDGAIRSYRQALTLTPKNVDALNNLGGLLLQRGDVNEAIDVFARAVTAQPSYPDAHNGLGAALLEAGRLQEALAEIREAIRLRPDFREAHSNHAEALRRINAGQKP